MEKQAIIELLNKDIEDEHGAIIQYLEHAYAMGEGEMACEIEAMARDEMRHLDWLSETVVALGGRPSLKRGKMIPGGGTVADWMTNNVALEQGAIDQYREHIKLIDDKTIKRLLNRIISDEEAHHGNFAHFVDKAQKHDMHDIRGDRQDKTTEVLDWGIEHEYTVILQYLLHSYMTPDAETSQQLEDQAINEMQHLGWLAEELVSGRGRPRLEHAEVDQSTKTTDMLQADINIEQQVADKYDRSAQETDDPDIKKLLLRIRDNERYHLSVFNDLFKKGE